ncbi:MAG TPA: hypothetical protein VMG38_11290 [Trebonia sp.]|nr:hypothetical protein [Trebonia sp.]
MTLRPPSADYQLPRLVRKCHLALEQQGTALSAALQEFALISPADGCPWEADVVTASRADEHVRAAQQRLLEWCQHQARLIYVNGHDHLTSMGRLLGGDGAMSLYAHVTLSRSVCEAAVRHAWLLDPSISYGERITRSAAMLSYNIGNRLKGARQGLGRGADSRIAQPIIAKCAAEFDDIHELIQHAGLDVVYDRNGHDVASVKLPGTGVKVPVKFETGPLMEELLPESPGWYLQSSGISHSATWLLDGAVLEGRGGPELSFTPDLMEVAAATQTAISASGLIIERHAAYYGFDPEPHVRKSRHRRGMLDALTREHRVKQATDPLPLMQAMP